MPSQAELDAQNNASRARQQARRGIEQPAPQVQQPYVNPYGGQYGTDSIQDQSYYDNYYDTSGDGYYDDDGYYQSGYNYDDYFEDEEMTDEEWAAYLAELGENPFLEEYQEEPSYYSDYGSRMPDGPIDYAPNARVGRSSVREGFQPTGGGGFSYAPNVPIPSDRYSSFIPSKEEAIGTASNIYQGIKNQFGTPEYQLSSPGYSQSQQTQQPEPEAETPFLQYLQENTERSQGGRANEMATPASVARLTTLPGDGVYDQYDAGVGQLSAGSPERNLIEEDLPGDIFYNPLAHGMAKMQLSIRERENAQGGDYQEQVVPMTGMRPIDPETGEPLSRGVIDAATRAGLELPMGSVPLPQAPQVQAPQVQAPMSISDTRGMLQERFGSPTVYDQPDRSFYDDQSILRDQRIENRPDFNEVTRDIDKYDNRRTFAEARRLVPTKRDKYGKITNREQQRAAMTLTEREVQDKKRDEYNEEYRAKNLEILQQRIDNGNKPGASKLEKKKGEVAEEILLVQETYENYQPWMGQAIEADRMNIVPPPSGFESHLDFAAYQYNFNLDELYETMNQENNGGGGAAPVQQRSPSPGGEPSGREIKMLAPNGKLMNVPEKFVEEMIAKGAKRA